MEYRRITPELLPAFRPYLLPEVAVALEAGEDNVLAWGAVNEEFHTCAAACIRQDEGAGCWVLLSLLVDPQVRRQGVARGLLKHLTEEYPLGAAIWFAPAAEQEGIAACLKLCGLSAIVMDRPIMRLDCDAMKTLPACRRAFSPTFRPDVNIIPLSEVTDEEIEELFQDESIPDELYPGVFDEEVLASPLSLAYRYKGVIAAYFLALPTVDGAVVKAAVSRKKIAHGGAFFQLAYAAMHNSIPYLPEKGGSYWLEAVSKEADTVAHYLCGEHAELWYEGTALQQNAVEE